MFDAYTIKKVLPRLVAAVVLIQLSWFIFTSMITLTNVVSYGIEALIMAPFPGGTQILDNPLTAALTGAGGGGGAYFVVFAGAAGVGALLAGSLAIFVLVSLVVGFLVLAIRRMVLIALLILSPLALVAWILPGTQRFWKMWWDNFSKLLLMFPMIVVMVSAGAALAQVIAGQNKMNIGAAEPINIVLIMACVFTPYFLIPQTYKAAGAGLGLAAGWIGGKAASGEGWMQKRRGAAQTARWQRRNTEFRAGELGGNRFRGTAVGHRINKIGEGVGLGRRGRFGMGTLGRQAAAQHMEMAGAKAAQENESIKQLALNNDDGAAVSWLSGGTLQGANAAADDLMAGWARENPALTQPELTARRDRAVAAATAAGLTKANSQALGSLVMQNSARSVAAGDWGTVQRGLERLHGNNGTALDDAMGSIEYWGREGKRADLGDRNGVQRGFERTGAHKAVRGYASSVGATTADAVNRYHAAVRAGDANGAFEAASGLIAMRNAAGPDVSEDSKQIIYDAIGSIGGIDLSSQQSLDEQFGGVLATNFGPGGPGQAQLASDFTENLRNRSALYDQGTRGIPPVGGGGGAGGP